MWFLFSVAFISAAFLSVRYWSILAWIFMAAASAFRYNSGPDYFQYLTIHEWILVAEEPFSISEPFHVVITLMSNFLGFGLQFVMFVYSLLTAIFFFLGFKYFSKTKIEFFLITSLYFSLLYLSSFNTVRVYLAAAIFLFSTRYILQKKILMYGLCCILAFLVHKSAILLLPMYLMGRMKIPRIFSILIVLALFLLSLGSFGVAKILVLSVSHLGLDYTSYLEYGRFSTSVTTYSLVLSVAILVLFSSLSFINISDRRERLCFNFLFFMVVVRMLALDFRILSRFDLYFKPFLIVFLCVLIFRVIQRLHVKEAWLLLYPALIFSSLIFSFQAHYVASSETAYRHYTFNIGIFSETPQVFGLFGDHNDASKWEK
jgi:transmembrane protein EpsG